MKKFVILALLLLVASALSLGCAQKKMENIGTTIQKQQNQTKSTQISTSQNVTKLENNINTTLESVNNLLNQVNDLSNVSFNL